MDITNPRFQQLTEAFRLEALRQQEAKNVEEQSLQEVEKAQERAYLEEQQRMAEEQKKAEDATKQLAAARKDVPQQLERARDIQERVERITSERAPETAGKHETISNNPIEEQTPGTITFEELVTDDFGGGGTGDKEFALNRAEWMGVRGGLTKTPTQYPPIFGAPPDMSEEEFSSILYYLHSGTTVKAMSFRSRAMAATGQIIDIWPAWPKFGGAYGESVLGLQLFSLDVLNGARKYFQFLVELKDFMDPDIYNLFARTYGKGINPDSGEIEDENAIPDIFPLSFWINNPGAIGEQISNQYGDTTLEQVANSIGQSTTAFRGITGITTPTGGTVQTNIKNFGDKLQSLSSKFGMGVDISGFINKLVELTGRHYDKVSPFIGLLTGARVDFPMIWETSRYDASYNLNVRLYNPNPTNMDYYKRYILTPLILLMLLSVPLTDAKYVYSFPFLLRARCPGLFYVPSGFVSNISVLKGGEANDITYQQQPGSVDIAFNITGLFDTLVALDKRKASDTDDLDRPTLTKYIKNMYDWYDYEPFWDEETDKPSIKRTTLGGFIPRSTSTSSDSQIVQVNSRLEEAKANAESRIDGRIINESNDLRNNNPFSYSGAGSGPGSPGSSASGGGLGGGVGAGGGGGSPGPPASGIEEDTEKDVIEEEVVEQKKSKENKKKKSIFSKLKKTVTKFAKKVVSKVTEFVGDAVNAVGSFVKGLAEITSAPLQEINKAIGQAQGEANRIAQEAQKTIPFINVMQKAAQFVNTVGGVVATGQAVVNGINSMAAQINNLPNQLNNISSSVSSNLPVSSSAMGEISNALNGFSQMVGQVNGLVTQVTGTFNQLTSIGTNITQSIDNLSNNFSSLSSSNVFSTIETLNSVTSNLSNISNTLTINLPNNIANSRFIQGITNVIDNVNTFTSNIVGGIENVTNNIQNIVTQVSNIPAAISNGINGLTQDINNINTAYNVMRSMGDSVQNINNQINYLTNDMVVYNIALQTGRINEIQELKDKINQKVNKIMDKIGVDDIINKVGNVVDNVTNVVNDVAQVGNQIVSTANQVVGTVTNTIGELNSSIQNIRNSVEGITDTISRL